MEDRKTKLLRLRETGRLGGLVGGPARHLALSPDRRSEIARIASNARWGRKAKVETILERPKDWAA